MRAIIIAAGLGSRLGDLTTDLPKCLLPLGDSGSILENTIRSLRNGGVEDITIIRGYQAEKIQEPGVTYRLNANYENNNILGSLFCAEADMEEGFIACYSDIVFSPTLVEQVLAHPAELSAVIDIDWKEKYAGRSEHPLSEAEKAILDSRGNIDQIGKALPEAAEGEFIGFIKCTASAQRQFREAYQNAQKTFSGKPFVRAASFEKAYLTDFLQYLVNEGTTVSSIQIAGDWREIDTEQDLLEASRFLSLPARRTA